MDTINLFLGEKNGGYQDTIQALVGTHLLVKSGEYILFAHDRVQQAALAMLADEKIRILHLQAGQNIRAVLDVQGLADERIDEYIQHYNNAEDLIKDVNQRLELAKLNITLGKRLKSNIIDFMPSLLIGVDIDGKVILWNKTAEQNTGITAGAAQGKTLPDVFPEMASEMKRIIKSIRTRQIERDIKKVRQTENGILYEDIIIYPLTINDIEGTVIRIDNVTDKIRMEEMMIQSEKMLSVGRLAAGMAHEINNPLAGMIQTARVMTRRLSQKNDIPANLKAAGEAGTTMKAIIKFMEIREIPRMLSAINESGRKVAATIDRMFSFARKSEGRVTSHSFEDLLDKTLILASTDYDLEKHYDFKMIEIIKEYEKGIPLVLCEETKIQQVFLNILGNGAQAMHKAGIETPHFILRIFFEEKLNMVCIEIEDNGPGMDEVTRKRIFEPFFTTSPAGEGTGLGLSVAYFIITENHNGEITVESQPGRGTKFIIRLPLERNG